MEDPAPHYRSFSFERCEKILKSEIFEREVRGGHRNHFVVVDLVPGISLSSWIMYDSFVK